MKSTWLEALAQACCNVGAALLQLGKVQALKFRRLGLLRPQQCRLALLHLVTAYRTMGHIQSGAGQPTDEIWMRCIFQYPAVINEAS